MLWAPLRRRTSAALPYGAAFFFHARKLAAGFVRFALRGEWTVIRSLLRAGWWKLVDDLGVHRAQVSRPRFEGAIGEAPGESGGE